MTHSSARERRAAGILTLKAAVTTASIAALVGGWAFISLVEAETTPSETATGLPELASSAVTRVGMPTPNPSAMAESNGALDPTATTTMTPTATATAEPTQVVIQPGQRRPPPGFGGAFTEPRTRTSR